MYIDFTVIGVLLIKKGEITKIPFNVKFKQKVDYQMAKSSGQTHLTNGKQMPYSKIRFPGLVSFVLYDPRWFDLQVDYFLNYWCHGFLATKIDVHVLMSDRINALSTSYHVIIIYIACYVHAHPLLFISGFSFCSKVQHWLNIKDVAVPCVTCKCLVIQIITSSVEI